MGTWLTVLLIVAPMLAFREFANQPCSSPVGCIIPAVYLGLKQLMIFVAGIVILVGTAKTILWTMRRLIS
jgi:hypothetical protein